MAGLSIEGIILAIIIGTLAAIVYSLRILVLLERRMGRIDLNIERLARKVLKEEISIEAEEKKIENMLKKKKKKK